MKTIGLIGGMGWQSTLQYYHAINSEISARLGGSHSARIIIDSHDFHSIANASTKAEYMAVQSLLVDSAQRLELAGADCVAMACNTVHRLASKVAAAVDIPLLHIADATRDALVRDGHSRVGILGTRATMEGSFYRSQMGGEIELIVPDNSGMNSVNQVARDINRGCSAEQYLPTMQEAVDTLLAQGCTAVILACTEFALVFGQTRQELAVTLYDSARLHALALVEFALAEPIRLQET
ncbi:MAG: amino acid racemase [Kofleriaceae bacterium]|nr:amino acid racemase [Kofleriaceae bacterium]